MVAVIVVVAIPLDSLLAEADLLPKLQGPVVKPNHSNGDPVKIEIAKGVVQQE